MWECGLDSHGSDYGPVSGFCEHGNEPSGVMKVAEFREQCGAFIINDNDRSFNDDDLPFD
jgi:hypothetical protein